MKRVRRSEGFAAAAAAFFLFVAVVAANTLSESIRPQILARPLLGMQRDLVTAKHSRETPRALYPLHCQLRLLTLQLKLVRHFLLQLSKFWSGLQAVRCSLTGVVTWL